MPPKKASAKASATAQVAKDRVSKKTAPKKPTTTKKTAATKATPVAAADKPTAPKRAAKTAGTAPSRRANIGKKRMSIDGEDEKENESPAANKPKATTPKPTTETTKAAATKTTTQKRKSTEEDEVKDVPPAKKAKTTTVKKVVDPVSKVKIGVQINFAPTKPLDVFVFGEGSAGELGLGSKKVEGKKPINVKRPRVNPNLSAETAGVVQIACGGMHAIALTKDNKILTWGVNDQGALGRSTAWDGGLRDADAAEDDDSDSDNDESGLNPYESTPTEINTKNIAPGTKFVQVAASDSASFALTEDGRVYSWGTFRATDGILGFDKDVKIQSLPVLLPEPKKVVAIVSGSNHVLALDNKGKIQTWGAGEQNQLGRRIVERDARTSSLRPAGLPVKRGVKITKVAAGSYHSFALTEDGKVYAWGLNNFGELGIEGNMGVDDATVLQPTLVESLADHKIVDIAGGEHHSVALTEDGEVLVWGRMDANQCGFEDDFYNTENCIYDENNRPRILKVPSAHKNIPAVASIAVGTDQSIAVTRDGKAYSWGFNTNYQCGQGETDEEVFPPELIENSVVREKKIVFAGCGGQFSVLASFHEA